MANRRQIPFLHWHRNADGTETGWWKPSPRLRKAGWTNRKLGTRSDEGAVILAAVTLNAELAEWEARGRGHDAPAAAPKRRTVGDCITAYRASAAWDALATATRHEYNVRLRFLEEWALKGTLPLEALDKPMVRDLKTALLANGGSLHRAGSIMRVLRLLLNWSIEQGWLTANPSTGVKIPTPPSRTMVLMPDDVDTVAAAALALGYPSLALGVHLGLWTFQREADLLAATRLAWRPVRNVEKSDAAVLANAKGDVMALRVHQRKTGAWVDCPMPPHLHGAIEEAFERSDTLLPDDLQPGRACPAYLFQRRARQALNDAGFPDAQFRDLRRSGMTMMADNGATLPGITAISGHAVLGRKTILDTYMPGNTRAACAAMATVLRSVAARQHKEEQG